MIETWEPRRYEGTSREGRTHPILLDCARRRGDSILRATFITKCDGLPEVTQGGLLNEVFGHAAAQALGVYTTTAAVISIDEQFAEQVNTAFAEARIEHRLRPGFAFGCEQIRGIGQVGPVLRDREIRDAQHIYGLDLLIQNPDRTAVRPNCGLHGGRVLAYDFDQAFSFRLLLGAPLDPCAVTTHGIASKHLFYRTLRNGPIDWTEFRDGVRSLSPEWLRSVCDALPESWKDAAQPWCEHLTAINARVDDFSAELVRSLQ